MTDQDKELLMYISDYADKVMPGEDIGKMQTQKQIMNLRPILQEMAMKYKMSVEDLFVKYMDLLSEQTTTLETKMNIDI